MSTNSTGTLKISALNKMGLGINKPVCQHTADNLWHGCHIVTCKKGKYVCIPRYGGRGRGTKFAAHPYLIFD